MVEVPESWLSSTERDGSSENGNLIPTTEEKKKDRANTSNLRWMIGEAHDYEYPDAKPIAMAHTLTSASILQIALSWVLFYYLIILPFNLLPCHPSALREYDDGTLPSRWPCFANFRQYENLHMMFWIAKDLAWCQLHLSMWIVSMFLTLGVALDCILLGIRHRAEIEDATVDIVHYCVSFLWIIGNSVWAYGDFFMGDFNEPQGLWITAADTFLTARWYSSWILFLATIPIGVMYGIWISLTWLGLLGENSEESDGAYDEWDTMALKMEESGDIELTNLVNSPLSLRGSNSDKTSATSARPLVDLSRITQRTSTSTATSASSSGAFSSKSTQQHWRS
eukprot:scaffold1709_cov158-Ochromonas_danica.AAC.8